MEGMDFLGIIGSLFTNKESVVLMVCVSGLALLLRHSLAVKGFAFWLPTIVGGALGAGSAYYRPTPEAAAVMPTGAVVLSLVTAFIIQGFACTILARLMYMAAPVRNLLDQVWAGPTSNTVAILGTAGAEKLADLKADAEAAKPKPPTAL